MKKVTLSRHKLHIDSLGKKDDGLEYGVFLDDMHEDSLETEKEAQAYIQGYSTGWSDSVYEMITALKAIRYVQVEK